MQLNDLTSHFLSLQTQSQSQGWRIFVTGFSVYFEMFMHFSNFLQQHVKTGPNLGHSKLLVFCSSPTATTEIMCEIQFTPAEQFS